MSVAQPKFEIQPLTLFADGYSFSTNAYLISRNSDAILVDPAGQAQTIFDTIKTGGFGLVGIVLTHEHPDHHGALSELIAKYNVPVYAHAKTLQTLDIPTFIAVDEGDSIILADESLQVLYTPGHSSGSICLLFDNKLVAGDTLFKGTCGRTDLPGGSATDMHNSLARLAQLDPSTIVYSGHDNITNIGDELNRGLSEY